MLKDFSTTRNQLTNLNKLDAVNKQNSKQVKQDAFMAKPDLAFGKNLLCSKEAGLALKSQNLANVTFKSKKGTATPELSEEELIEKLQDLQQNVPPAKIGLALMAHPEYIQGICKKGIKELSKEIKKETDPKKIEELEQMKTILEFNLGETEKSKKASKLSFKGSSLEEKDERAWDVVHGFAASEAGVAFLCAQGAGGDEAVLFAMSGAMAGSIAKIYGLNVLDVLGSGGTGSVVASTIGIKLASKAFTWFPGAGNLLNAVIAAGTTEMVGCGLIALFHTVSADPSKAEDIRNGNYDPKEMIEKGKRLK